LSPPTSLSAHQTHSHLSAFLASIPASPARTQLERLTDSLGVDLGFIAPSEGDRREAERAAARSKARGERKRRREEEERRAREEEMGGMEGWVEGLADRDEGEEKVEYGNEPLEGGEGAERRDGGDEDADEDLEEGGVGAPGEHDMEDRGDVEYGDEQGEDEDEPDNEDEGS